MGALRRPAGHGGRHAQLRCLGARQGRDEALRLHPGKNCGGGQGPDCEMESNMNPLQALREHGQSVWLDLLSRDLLASGELARLVAQDALAGVTADPSIFEKAILDSTAYDADFGGAISDGDTCVTGLCERPALPHYPRPHI